MFKQLFAFSVLCLVLISVSFTGCNSSDSPVVPNTTENRVATGGTSSQCLWGYYTITINPDTLQAEVVPLRGVMFTANVTQFMQPPIQPTNMISLAIDPASDFATGYIVVDVTLRHPFPGMNYYNGFDVRGIFMADATGNLSYDSDATYPIGDDSILLNADGYSRWWNWEEFGPVGTVFGPTYGMMAHPTATSGTLNGYKYFCDTLDETTDDFSLAETSGGFFSSENVNTRQYEIQFKMDGSSILFDFQYAVDASWSEPDPSFAPDYPMAAFSPNAHMAEAWLIEVEDAGSTAYYVDGTNYGGSLILDIAVYDWQAAGNVSGVMGELSGLWLEGEVVASPVDLLAIATVSSGSTTSSVFQVELDSLTLSKSGENEVWIIAESANPSTYEPNIDGFDTSPFTWCDSNLASYLRTSVEISDVASAPVVISIDPVEGDQNAIVPVTITGNNFVDGCQVELRESAGTHVVEADNESWTDETEVTCDLDLTGAPLGLYDVVVINPDLLEGSLVEGFEVLEADVIYVDDSNTSGVEDGTKTNPYNTIQEGLAAASADWEVRVDDSGTDYTGPVTLVADVVLKSVNWDDSDGGDEATISGGSSVVVGADDATIDGFEIDGSYCCIECDGTSPEILNCRAVGVAGSNARAIWLHNGALPHLDGVEVYDVRTTSNYQTCYGIYIQDCDAVGADNLVIEHTKVHYIRSTGGIDPGYRYEHGMYINNSDGVQIKNSIFYDIAGGNYNTTYGVRINNSQDVELTNIVIYDVRKNCYYGSVYGLYMSSVLNIDVRNSIISRIHRNSNFQTARGVYLSNYTYTFEYNNVYDCSSSLYSGVTPGTGCISADPLYVNAGTDFHLAAGSPCINTGDPTILDPDSSQSDMGAYGGPGGNW